jgi:chaperone BCS1
MRWLGDNVTTFQIRKITGATEKAPEEKSDEKSPLEKPSTNNPDSNNNPTKPAPEDDDDDGCACSWNNQSGAGCIYKLRPAPGYGSHFFQYKGNLIFLERHAMDPKCILNMTSQEMLTLTVPRWNFSILQEILDLAKPKKSNSNKQLVIYKAVEDYWTQLGGRKKKRPLDTIFLSGEVITSLLNDLRTFLTLEDWYVQRGIPYRRGYLLYGPPGCGKTSVIKAIAGTIGYDICVFSLSQKMTDDSLCELLNSAPEKSLILLEDIDSAFKSREDSDASARETNLAFEGCSQSSLTFRGLLNALDGVASSEDGQIIFMTTNYPEKLDPALVRPGRVDYKVHIDYPDDLQLERMFQMFYPEAEQTLSKTFVKTVRAQDDLKLSMAMAQGLFLMYKDSPQDAVKNVKEHFKKQFSNVNVNKPSCGLYM